uniref:Uncharacterized protein n=1 Tax=Pararge aegeria TaxID=116150 RepID=S4NIW3_9NEOP
MFFFFDFIRYTTLFFIFIYIYTNVDRMLRLKMVRMLHDYFELKLSQSDILYKYSDFILSYKIRDPPLFNVYSTYYLLLKKILECNKKFMI